MAVLAWQPAFAAPDAPDVVYLNACAAGCTVEPGINDAVARTSSLVNATSQLAAFPDGDAVFNEVAACVRTTLLPFNVHVVASDPGGPRREVILSTSSEQLAGGPSGLAASAPFDGVAHDNWIAFVFADQFGPTAVEGLCATVAQQIGFLYGIEYVTGNCSDIEDQSTGCGEKAFTDQDSACAGAFSSPGQCILGNTTQNSYQRILAVAAASDYVFANSFEAFEFPSPGPSP